MSTLSQILSKPELESKIKSFKLVPSEGGRFEFSVNGELLFSKKSLGRHAEPNEVLNLLTAHIMERE